MEYKFVPGKVSNNVLIDNIISKELLFKNDIYETYAIIVKEFPGNLIVCTDSTKMKKCDKICVKESYAEYLDYIKNHNFEKEKWIYNIIDGLEEQENILFKDLESQYVIIPSYTWKLDESDKSCIDKLHILAIHTNILKRCLRDLTGDDLPWLREVKEVTCAVIQYNFGLSESQLKIFIHYEPSTYLLHIHFMNVINVEANSSCEYSHELNSIIFNLELDTDYYKKIMLNRRISA